MLISSNPDAQTSKKAYQGLKSLSRLNHHLTVTLATGGHCLWFDLNRVNVWSTKRNERQSRTVLNTFTNHFILQLIGAVSPDGPGVRAHSEHCPSYRFEKSPKEAFESLRESNIDSNTHGFGNEMEPGHPLSLRR